MNGEIGAGPRVGEKVRVADGNHRAPMEIVEVTPMGLWLRNTYDPPEVQIQFFGYARYDFELVRPPT